MVTIMRDVMDQYDRSQFELLTEIARLSFGEGKIGPDEYIEQRLFDRAQLKGELKDFVGVFGSKAISRAINHDRRFDAVITDKITFYTLFNGLGVPTIQTKAYYSSDLSLPGLNTLATKEALLGFLLEPTNYPFFGKPSYSSLSLGAIGARSIDAHPRPLS